jgi:hypothetical protein
VLFRADLLRGGHPVYDESTIHADEVACYEILQRADFGFVHQVLTYTRVHEASVTTSFARRMDSYHAGALLVLHRFGPVYLTPAEYAARRRVRLRNYYRCLARAALAGRDRRYWDYHRGVLARVGEPLSPFRVIGALVGGVADALARPLWALYRSARQDQRGGGLAQARVAASAGDPRGGGLAQARVAASAGDPRGGGPAAPPWRSAP